MSPRQSRTLTRWTFSALALVCAAAWAFPVYWMVSSSLMSNARLRSATPSFWQIGRAHV